MRYLFVILSIFLLSQSAFAACPVGTYPAPAQPTECLPCSFPPSVQETSGGIAPNDWYIKAEFTGTGTTVTDCPYKITCKGTEFDTNTNTCGTACPTNSRGATVTISGLAGTVTNVSPQNFVACPAPTPIYELFYFSVFSDITTTIGYEKYDVGFATTADATDWNPEKFNIKDGTGETNKYTITNFADGSDIFKRTLLERNGVYWVPTGNAGPKTFIADTQLYPTYTAKTFNIQYINGTGNLNNQHIQECTYNKWNGRPLDADTEIRNCAVENLPDNWTAQNGTEFKGWYCYNNYNTDKQSPCANMEIGVSIQAGAHFYEFAGDTPSNYTMVAQWGICEDGYYVPDGQLNAVQCEKGYYCTGCKRYNCGLGNFCPTDGATAPTQCEANHYCDGENLTEQKKCPYGKKSPAGATSKDACQYGDVTNTKFCDNNGCFTLPAGAFVIK